MINYLTNLFKTALTSADIASKKALIIYYKMCSSAATGKRVEFRVGINLALFIGIAMVIMLVVD